jgi:hypothetical protein
VDLASEIDDRFKGAAGGREDDDVVVVAAMDVVIAIKMLKKETV